MIKIPNKKNIESNPQHDRTDFIDHSFTARSTAYNPNQSIDEPHIKADHDYGNPSSIKNDNSDTKNQLVIGEVLAVENQRESEFNSPMMRRMQSN